MPNLTFDSSQVETCARHRICKTQIPVGGMGLQPLRKKSKFEEPQIIWHVVIRMINIYQAQNIC